MAEQQTYALRLAQDLDNLSCEKTARFYGAKTLTIAAAELRRLQAEVEFHRSDASRVSALLLDAQIKAERLQAERGDVVGWRKRYSDGSVSMVEAQTFIAEDALSTGWRPLVYGDTHPAAPAKVPLSREQMEKGRESIFSVDNPYCPCDSKTFRKVAEWVERRHGITHNGLTLGTDGDGGAQA